MTGEWDFVAILRLREPDQLAQVVTGAISQLPGVARTETMVAFEVFSRHDLEAMFSLGGSSSALVERGEHRVVGVRRDRLPRGCAQPGRACGASVRRWSMARGERSGSSGRDDPARLVVTDEPARDRAHRGGGDHRSALVHGLVADEAPWLAEAGRGDRGEQRELGGGVGDRELGSRERSEEAGARYVVERAGVRAVADQDQGGVGAARCRQASASTSAPFSGTRRPT